MVNNCLYKKIDIIVIILYVLILFTYDFKDNLKYLLIITALVIFILYKTKDNKIVENLEDYEKTIEEMFEEQTTTSTATNQEKIEAILNRIKILEEMARLKNWSQAQSYELTRLKGYINEMNEMNENKKEGTTITQSTILSDVPVKQIDVPLLSKNNPIQPMGTFDGLCIDEMVKRQDYNLIDEDELKTYLGYTIPLELNKTMGGLSGPSVDGHEGSPKKMSIFGNNQSSISCCDKSSFFTSTGCICLTDKQEKYIGSRGGNHILPEKEQCPL